MQQKFVFRRSIHSRGSRKIVNMACVAIAAVLIFLYGGGVLLGGVFTGITDFYVETVVFAEETAIAPSIDAGIYHNAALKNDGTVWCWGANTVGQLGNGTSKDSNIPVQVKNLDHIVAVSAGGDSNWDGFTLALKDDGTVWGWGSNDSGQLGNGTYVDQIKPVQIKNLTNVKAISAGRWHALALKEDGTVWSWGDNMYGRLGNGSQVSSGIPVQVKGLRGVIRIQAGEGHSVALKGDGTVWSWGNNDYGQLGNGSTRNSSIPVQMLVPKCIDLCANGSTTLLLLNDGTVAGCGSDGLGLLKIESTSKQYYFSSPIPVTGLSEIKQISLGDFHAMALKTDGSVYCWGSNEVGESGREAFWYSDSDNLTKVEGMTHVSAISADCHHSMAMKEDGTVWCWGIGSQGHLGDGTEAGMTSTPVQVKGLNLLGLTPTPSPTPTPAPQISFTDVKKTDWFYDNVKLLVSKGIIGGYPDGSFKPAGNVNVDAFIKMVVASLGYTGIENSPGYWADSYINKAKELGLVLEGEFNIYSRDITRGEMARIIVRALDEEESEDLVSYASRIKDYEKINPELRGYVLQAFSKGIITGYNDGEFKDTRNATRSEAATMIARMIEPALRIAPMDE